MTLALDSIPEAKTQTKFWSISSQNDISNNLNTQLKNTLDRTCKNNLIYGQTIAIVSDFGSWFGASGYSNWLPKKAMLVDDIIPIGTITKIFTAITVLQLAAEGLLGLEDPIDIWLEENLLDLIPDANNITIRQLLNNSSGIANKINCCQKYSEENIYISSQNIDRIWTSEEVVKYICDKNSSEIDPNIKKWFYSNLDYILAGIIVEQATDNTVAKEFQKRIIKPLGLENTFYCNNFDRIVRGYDRNGQDISHFNPSQLSALGAAGAIVSNVKDLTKFYRSLLDNKLIDRQQKKEFDKIKYSGLGLKNKRFAREKAIGYCSNLLGYNAQMWHFPDSNITVVSLQNNSYLEAIAKPYYLGSEGPIADLCSIFKQQINSDLTSESNFILSLIMSSVNAKNPDSLYLAKII